MVSEALPPLDEIHTIKIVANGQHGGWDIIIDSMKEVGTADWEESTVTYTRDYLQSVVQLLSKLR